MAVDTKAALAVTLTSNNKTIGYDSQTITETAPESITQTMVIPAQTTDLSVGLGPVTAAQTVYITSDQYISAKINGALTGVRFKTFLLMGSDLASITLSNALTQPANVTIYITGA